jgi:hypothetical protein
MAIKPIIRYGKFTPTGVDRSGETRMRALAGLGEQVYDITRDVVKTKREQEAVGEAVQAAEEARTVDPATGQITYGEVEQRGALKFGSAQFNQALNSTVRSQREQDSRAKIAEYKETYKDDPTGFQNASEGYLKGLLESAPEEMRPTIRQDVSSRILTAQTTINTNFQTKQKQTAINLHKGNINDGVTEATRLARMGDADALAVEKQSVFASIDARALVDEDFDPVAAKQQFNNLVNEQTELHKINALFDEDPESAYAYLDDLRGKIPEGVDPNKWSKFTTSAQTELGRRATANAIKNKRKAQQDREYVDGVVAQIGMGTANPEDVQKAIDMSEGTDQAKNIQDAQEVAQYSAQPTSERTKLRNKAEELGTEGAELLVKMEAQEYKIQQALAKDPMGLAIQQGVVDLGEFNPLNPTPESVALAKEKASEASEHYGVQIPILTASQTTRLIEYFNSEDITAEQQASIARVYGADSGIWSQFSQENARVYAQGATHPDATVSTGIFKGNYRLKQGNVKVKGTDKSDAEDIFIKYIGSDTVPDKDATALYEASLAYYASTVGQGADFDKDAFKSAVKAVTGNVETVRGFKTILPKDVSSDDLEKYFDNMSELEYRKIAGDKPDNQVKMDLELIRNADRIVAIKDGKYLVTHANGQAVFNANGMPLEFTVNAETISNNMLRTGKTLGQYEEELRERTAQRQAATAEAQMNVLEQRTTRF